jgi:hypothetical protein
MAKRAPSGRRPKTVVRSSRTGRFVKNSAAKFNPKATVVEKVEVKESSVEIARSASTGRFVKKSTARRHPARTVVTKVKR